MKKSKFLKEALRLMLTLVAMVVGAASGVMMAAASDLPDAGVAADIDF